MSLKITGVRSATSEEWDHIWGNCDYSTYFHSREWAETWQKYTQGELRPDAKLITFSDDKSVLLPFSSRRVFRGFFKQYVSSPAGTFGGWLSLNKLSENHGRLLHKYIATHCKNLTWRFNPYNLLESSLNINNAEHDETHALDLESGFETLFKGWTKGHATAALKARKARKAGIEVRTAITLQDWELYYKIYEDSLKRWGESASSRYDWLLFQSMYELSSINIKLWLATFEGNAVAGALCFYAKRHVVYWHGSAFSEFFKLRPVNLLLYEIIKNSCEHGFQWFDFNPSGGHEGVKAFKKSFGADELACPVLNSENNTIKFARSIQHSITNIFS